MSTWTVWLDTLNPTRKPIIEEGEHHTRLEYRRAHRVEADSKEAAYRAVMEARELERRRRGRAS